MEAVRKLPVRDDRDEQVVRLPSDLRLPGSEVVVYREGERIILEPVETGAVRVGHPANRRLAELLATLEPIEDEDFGRIDDLPPEPVDL